MMKKIIIAVFSIIFLLIGIGLFYKNKENKNNNETNNIVTNEVELSSYVEDDCLNEWEDYTSTIQEEIYEASQNISDEDKVYKIKAEDNYIKVYYINKEKEEVLYKVTDISVNYLENEDVEKLKEGILVKGNQNLNQLLEDFE